MKPSFKRKGESLPTIHFSGANWLLVSGRVNDGNFNEISPHKVVNRKQRLVKTKLWLLVSGRVVISFIIIIIIIIIIITNIILQSFYTTSTSCPSTTYPIQVPKLNQYALERSLQHLYPRPARLVKCPRRVWSGGGVWGKCHGTSEIE